MHELLIKIDEKEWQQIQEIARRLNCSIEEVAHRAISRLVLHTTPPADEWKKQLNEVLELVHQRTASYTSEEIEADITAAYKEYRQNAGGD